MAADGDEAQVLSKIQDTYVPFLKKLIAFLEKNKKATPENLNKLKAIYTIFTTAPAREQVETFHANQKKLENWYNKAQKEKQAEEGDSSRGIKRSLVSSDTESSQGAPDSATPSAKRSTFANSINSESSQPSIILVQSVNQSTKPPIPISQIKKEKVDPPKNVQPVQNNKQVTTMAKPSTPQPPPKPPTPPASIDPNEPITFTCASCQFQTKDETEFMKHARTDHRTDLSMWCKQCGKCFSNAGVLVSHIKERACIKEEMIYKCGVKDCIFETTSGQTFVHHLRHCHKGSPFIFCVHCQKIFTLPHCLILHMQDDCPFKEKNRRNPSSVPIENDKAKTNSTPSATGPSIVKPTAPTLSIRAQAPGITYSARPPVPRASPVVSAIRPLPAVGTPIRARGRIYARGRGRGRSRPRISDSSDSDDPDDPSWRPEETLGETGLRRSGRWAKKVHDVRNPELSTLVSTPSTKKSFTDAEINTKMISCPCCDFLAAFQSVLEDHYIANHKVPNKNACLVCHLKFESTQSFLEHFEEHRKGVLPNRPPSEMMENSKPVEKPKPIEAPKPVEKPKQIELPLKEPVEKVSSDTSALVDNEPFDGVLTSIADANLADPQACKERSVKIPYQAAIHDKNLKDSKLKKFEELKSPNDLVSMKVIEKLKSFFKCGLYNCTFTTSINTEFSIHLSSNHEGKRYHCCYCLKEYFHADSMANHVALNHNNRMYQCSKCFYRAYSKAHVQIHIKNTHSQDTDCEILVCEAVEIPEDKAEIDSPPEVVDTTWPYICAIGECSFNTYDPKEFKRHNETIHRTVSVFYCHYCKVDFLTFKRLMNHYRLHGLNTFQCNYCIHGAETKEEILLHLCNAHADLPLKAYMRGSQKEASSEVKELNSIAAQDDSNDSNLSQTLAVKDTSNGKAANSFTGCENLLYHVIDNVCYPKHLQFMCYPRYTRNLVSDIVCGIAFCQEKFASLHMYTSHLRNVHVALNFPCPHCPEVYLNWEDYKNHVLCHGSKLYTCSSRECGYYDWNKEKVQEHTKGHDDVDCNVVAIREFSTEEHEGSKILPLELNFEVPQSGDAYACLFCKYKSSDRNIMKNHMYKEMAYLRFNCRLCDKRYLSRKDVKDHFISAHPGLDILCSTDHNSEVEAMVKTALKLQDQLSEATLAESCDMCCKKIKNPVRLQSHLYICLQKEYHPYECLHCKKSYVNLLAVKFHTDEDHPSKSMDVAVASNYAIENDIGKKLLKTRLKQLKEVFDANKIEIGNNDGNSSKLKFYTCSVCPFEADHKFSVQKHMREQHEDKNGVVIKAMHRLSSCDNLNSQFDENSNDSSSSTIHIKRYGCGFCVRKMYTIQEMENHVKGVHRAKSTEEYFYYYTPDVNMQFAPDDKDTFECAYCKSSRENLFSLKNHSDLMHSEMEFKVKGYVSHVQSQNYLACGYCYLKVENVAELQTHSKSLHPLLTLKSIGDAHSNKSKRLHDSTDDIPNKRIKFGSAVFVCSHCGAAFSSEEHFTVHSNKAHSRFQPEFRKVDPSNSVEPTDIKFYKCEFCKFTSERQFLDKHLATKHKMRVTCSYCNKRFEFATKLKEHHDVAHKDLPLKYSQETIHADTPTSDSNAVETKTIVEANKDERKSKVIPEPFTYYGKQPEPVDLSSLTVHMDTKEGPSANLPLVYVTELFNMFPKVIVKDCNKVEPCE